MNGIYNLGLEKFLSSLGMRGFVGVWRPLTCGNRPVSNRNLKKIRGHQLVTKITLCAFNPKAKMYYLTLQGCNKASGLTVHLVAIQFIYVQTNDLTHCNYVRNLSNDRLLLRARLLLKQGLDWRWISHS